MRGWTLTACVVAACGDNAPPQAHEVMAIPSASTNKLDLLFVADNEGSTFEHQVAMVRAFPSLLAEISIDGRPDLHIGTITPDMGASTKSGAVGPGIGMGQGSCYNLGDRGKLHRLDSTIPDLYLVDSASETNHPNALVDDLAQSLEVGSSGCGYQQYLSAARAMFDNASNAGFRRSDAALGIVVIADEDDCSALDPAMFDPASTATLGPHSHFRCVQYGVTCAEPDMTTVGPRADCKPNAASTLVEDPLDFLPILQSHADDPRRVAFAAVIGPPDVAIEQRVLTGGTSVPALAFACEWLEANNQANVAEPSVRLGALAAQFGDRGTTASICHQDLARTATEVGMTMRRAMGDSCIEDDLELASCTVVDQLGTTEATLPPCAGATSSCYEVVTDEAACPHAAHQKLVVHHDAAPGTYTLVRC